MTGEEPKEQVESAKGNEETAATPEGSPDRGDGADASGTSSPEAAQEQDSAEVTQSSAEEAENSESPGAESALEAGQATEEREENVPEDEQEAEEEGGSIVSPRLGELESEAEFESELESDAEELTGVPRVCTYTRALDMSGARLIRVPVDILEYSSLVQLLLEKNLISTIQPELLALHRLEVLSLASNSLSSLPENLDTAWPRLAKLDLSKNAFEEFPEALTKLTALGTLRFSHNLITKLPTTITAMEGLNGFDLRNNRLEALPANFAELKGLKRLALQTNQLQELPAGLENLQLESIGIMWNPGEAAMAEALANCKNLTIDTKGADAEASSKLPKSWSSKIGLKSRDFTPSRKTSKQKVSKSAKRKSATHDDHSSIPYGSITAATKKAQREKGGEKRDKSTEKRSGEKEEKKKRDRSKKPAVDKVSTKQEVDLLPGKFQNGINFALTGSELRVRGASIDRLIALLTYDCGIDLAEYQRTFITMYPEIIGDKELLDALIERHKTGGLVAKERVIKLLNLWISTHKTRFFGEAGKELHEGLVSFCKTVGPKGDSLVALLGRLEKRVKKMPHGGGWHELEAKSSTFQRTMSMQFSSVDAQKQSHHHDGGWKDLKPRKLAEQLCLISHAQFKHIEVHEWLDKAWSKENGEELAPNLVNFINWTNHESAVLAASVLQPTLSARSQAITQLLNTAEKCVELNNFSSAWSIFSALNGAAINQQRLKASWEGVPMKAIRILHELEVLFNMSNNFLNFRTQLKKVKPPCIPSVMLVTKDLIFMDEGNPKTLKDGSINFELYNMKAQTVLHVRDLQRLGYDDFVPNDAIQREFFEAKEMSNQEMYELSQVLEPKASSGGGEAKAEKGEGRSRAEGKGKSGTQKAAKKRQTFRALAKHLFSDADLTKTMEEGSQGQKERDRSPRSRSKTLATPREQLAELERQGIVIPACGDITGVAATQSESSPANLGAKTTQEERDSFSAASPPPMRGSRDDSSLPSSRMSATRKKTLEADGERSLLARDDSGLEKTDRQFAALLSPRALTTPPPSAPSSPKLDPAKRITVRTHAQSVEALHQTMESLPPASAAETPQRSNRTMIKRGAGSGAPGTGLARRPLNFLAPPLPVGDLSDNDREEEDDDLPPLEAPSPAGGPAAAVVAGATMAQRTDSQLEGEAIFAELSGMLGPGSPSLPSSPAPDRRHDDDNGDGENDDEDDEDDDDYDVDDGDIGDDCGVGGGASCRGAAELAAKAAADLQSAEDEATAEAAVAVTADAADD
mmetsp:Transcript_16208/g.63201  ORF Transcript_16208/g.63201 Transcript_16208/m.63201 type:complete len:1265 (+) Transcript_16208:177-3971(+)|eukprot:CAMPEP_0114619640 /NCGR_PEP_ID=MMETSP0168-20121206/8315_1 /TAXON_ID=95228 ORGANISM="Vannella sp., Strain DIVA3 517/6/12" /NCGR_SAMPLE_ID=MMETSP0168 /ASSEMBLY_ACC=CAM_ASM_000044 /LENGTH=1264 /DNA_ID=CAMNT_0001830809 /DNA_START=168 /DNA_END=3962 /DNA_ORIENTATION=+